MDEQDRRRAPRAPERVALSLRDAGRELQTESNNLSAAGIYCTLEQFIPPMSKLEVRFELPVGLRPARIRCTGVVVRVEPAVNDAEKIRYNTALFFTEISKRDRAAISRFVRQRLAATRPPD